MNTNISKSNVNDLISSIKLDSNSSNTSNNNLGKSNRKQSLSNNKVVKFKLNKTSNNNLPSLRQYKSIKNIDTSSKLNLIKDSIQISNNANNNNNEKEENILSKFNKGNMLVAVRLRPLNNKELSLNLSPVIQITNNEQVTVLNINSVLNSNKNSEYTFNNSIGHVNNKHQHFFFDYAFDEDSSQNDIYLKTTKFLLKGVLDGYNATVLAYGATGCGKTYTMVGESNNEGIMVRSLADLFKLKDECESNEDKDIKISMSYIEIYNETVLDLMVTKSNSHSLELYEDNNKLTIINGVSEIVVNNAQEVFKLLM